MKKKLLLTWGYHRKGWVEPLLQLSDSFDLHFLFFLSEEEDGVREFPFPRYYWHNFNSAQEIIQAINPDAIVFMSLDTGLSLGLNLIAKQENIPTFILQHGLYRDFAFYLKFSNSPSNTDNQPPKLAGSGKRTLKFMLHSLRLCNLVSFTKIFWFLYQTRKKGIQVALHQHFHACMKPTKYLGFTHHNMRVHFQREGIEEKDVVIVGNPYFDSILFYKKGTNPPKDKYLLLIDQPLAENCFGYLYDTGISKEQVNIFYQKLNEFAIKNGCKLFIKLHPGSYRSTFMIEHPNIVYLKDEKPVEVLIGEAEGCLGCASTLMLPVLYARPAILFSYDTAEDVENMGQYGLARIYDYNSFEVDQLEFIEKRNDESLRQAFVDKFLYQPETKALDRLAEVLRSAV